ncbi:hypothetical protein GCM10025867_15700 [Frondihabitans sucicola]|uniref:Uncharacterized protein n=1 Tax=Frondihabitans sucicola TaxID=1268041 RepID=A0ABM8GLP2_9MICO|nr:hypothetical protein GCM10025867_15700 [Frondihabitans sucicola]
MKLRRGNDDNGIDAVFTSRLASEKILPRRISSTRVDEKLSSGRIRNRRIDAHGTGDDVGQSVGAQGQQVGSSDDGVKTASDNAEPDAATQPGYE